MRFDLPQNGCTNPQKLYHKKKRFARVFRKTWKILTVDPVNPCEPLFLTDLYHFLASDSSLHAIFPNVTHLTLLACFCILICIHIRFFLAYKQCFLALIIAIFYLLCIPDHCMFFRMKCCKVWFFWIGIGFIGFRAHKGNFGLFVHTNYLFLFLPNFILL